MKRVPIYGILTLVSAVTLGYLIDNDWRWWVLGGVLCFMAGIGSQELDTRRAGGGQ